MTGQPQSYVADSFFTIHSIITRGLEVSIKGTQGVIQQGFQSEREREGLFNYIRALSSVLNAHHLTEDEIAFPYFQEKLPGAPFKVLINWHKEMVVMLDEINQAVENCDKNILFDANLRKLADSLTELNASWQPHIEMEANDFINKADALIPVEEQLRLVRLFSEHGQKLAGPAYLTVPFLLYNLPMQQRIPFAAQMPAEVTQNLVPIVWKEKWESMMPYLIS